MVSINKKISRTFHFMRQRHLSQRSIKFKARMMSSGKTRKIAEDCRVPKKYLERSHHKTRCVARGSRQEHGIDFIDPYTAVVKAMSFKALFALTAYLDQECEQVDIITAFLNSPLKELGYADPPEGYRIEICVWLLKRALYCLKESSREWYDTPKEFLISLDFTHINADHSVFVNRRKKRLIINAYVDDLLLFRPQGTQKIPACYIEENNDQH